MSPELALIIVGSVFSSLLTFAIFYLREIKASFTGSQERQDKAIEKLKQKFEDLPEKYVFRDDFIRWTIGIDKKIDNLAKDIKSLMNRRNNGVSTRESGN